MYSATVREHAVNPQNRREMPNATATGRAAYQRCGDKLTMHFLIEEEVIRDVSFTAKGCGPVIAAASLATTMLLGKTVVEARSLSAFQLHDALGGMPVSKRHALLLVFQCLGEALGDTPKTNI